MDSPEFVSELATGRVGIAVARVLSMKTTSRDLGPGTARPLCLRIVDPARESLTIADLQRLFSASALTVERCERLWERPSLLVACNDRVVGIASYRWSDGELLVPDMGIDADSPCDQRAVIEALLEALELACMAGGRLRIALTGPQREIGAVAERRGYTANGPTRLEKRLL